MKKVLEILNNFSEFLGKIPSIGYALAYLFCIPFFAFIYWILPYHFYHSTVRYESVLNSDADEILEGIRNAIIDEFKRCYGSLIATEGNWSLNISNIKVYSLKPETDKTRFSIRLELWGIKNLKGVQYIIPLDLYIENRISFASFEPNDKRWIVYKRPQIQNPNNLPISLRFIFPHKLNESSIPATATNETIWFPIPKHLNEKIIAFSHTVKGFPVKASGSYARMFYFSVVTITTLGYGDIVPITNMARIIVATESILGIVLIGLFLNSLSKEHRDA